MHLDYVIKCPVCGGKDVTLYLTTTNHLCLDSKCCNIPTCRTDPKRTIQKYVCDKCEHVGYKESVFVNKVWSETEA